MTDEITTNEVLAVKLDYIQKDISAIKKDVSEIKADFITRREFEVHIRDSEASIKSRFLLSDARIDDVLEKANFSNKVLYSVVGLVITSILIAAMRFLLVQ